MVAEKTLECVPQLVLTGDMIRPKHSLANVIAEASRISQQFTEEERCVLMLDHELFVGNGPGQRDMLRENAPVTPPPVVVWEEREVEPLARPDAVQFSTEIVVSACEEEPTTL